MHPLAKLGLLIFLATITAMSLTPALEQRFGKSTVLKWALFVVVALALTLLGLAIALMTSQTGT